MAETFMINQLMTESKNMMQSERLKQEKEITITQDVW